MSMFIQVIEGHTSDPAKFRETLEMWADKIRPGAIGVLGVTTVIADDGSVVTMARFENAEKAAQNSARPEQHEFSEALMAVADGPPTFHDCNEVELFLGGGSDDAGFVQVMIGTAVDKAKAMAAEKAITPMLSELRPDVLGGVTAWDGDWWCQAIYFTSEADAREGEKKFETLSGDDRKAFEEMMAAYGEPRFVDGRNPLFA
jgi:hypothetical protein